MPDLLTVHQRAVAFLGEHHVITLATSDAQGPWAAPVFYVHLGFTLYFVSSPRSRHARQVAIQPRAAGAIHAAARDWRDIQGLQLEGVVTHLAGEELVAAKACYTARFAFVNDTEPLAAALARIAWYRFQPTRLWFLDNRVAFGQREEFTP